MVMLQEPASRTKLFRRQAIEEARPDAVRGGILRLAPPWTAGLYLSLLVVFLAALGTAIFGTVRIHSSGRGIMRPEARVLDVRAPLSGTVESIVAREGDRVDTGQLLLSFDETALLADADRTGLPINLLLRQREQLRVHAAASGVVDRLLVRPGSYVVAGDPIARIVPGDGRLLGYLSLPARDRPYLREGDPVALKFDAYPWQEMGVGWGTVTRVGADAESGAEDGEQTTVRLAVRVDSLPPGAPQAAALYNGMGFTGEVTLRTARIYELLFKPLARTPAAAGTGGE
jgi:hypothetical protein